MWGTGIAVYSVQYIYIYIFFLVCSFLPTVAIGGLRRPCVSCSAMAYEALPRDSSHYSWPESV